MFAEKPGGGPENQLRFVIAAEQDQQEQREPNQSDHVGACFESMLLKLLLHQLLLKLLLYQLQCV
jgi:hypothetical protein